MLQRLDGWYGKKTVRSVIGLIVVLAGIGVFISRQTPQAVETTDVELQRVRTASVTELQNGYSLSLIGTARALTEATIQTEVGGRVVRVNATLGSVVPRNFVLIELENASERASVLQAEGVYEAALAGSAQNTIGVNDAEITLRAAQEAGLTAYRSAYTTVDSIVHNTIDDLFSNFSTANDTISGFRVNSFGQSNSLSSERSALIPVLSEWRTVVFAQSELSSAKDLLTDAKNVTRRVAALTDTIASILSDDRNTNKMVAGLGIDAVSAEFLSARTNLNATLSSLETATTRIQNAEEALERAHIAASGRTVSVSDAQVKQALGALRAAQAQLEKTIIRTPITGTLNQLSVRAGDFVGSSEVVARVANNNVLEVTTYIGEADRTRVAVGDSVRIEGGAQGTVTAVAPAVDPTTRKVEVRIQTESDSVANGDTVRLTILPLETQQAATPEVLRVPLTAVKLTAEHAFVFTVKDSVLVAHPVVLGSPNGASVIIEEGLEPTWHIVTDARGLIAGKQVEVLTN